MKQFMTKAGFLRQRDILVRAIGKVIRRVVDEAQAETNKRIDALEARLKELELR
jgi:hypothetical protein